MLSAAGSESRGDNIKPWLRYPSYVARNRTGEHRAPCWQTEIPATNEHGNARSVGRVQSIVSNAGEVDGIRLQSTRTIELIFDQRSNGTTLALALPARFVIGYGLPGSTGAQQAMRDWLLIGQEEDCERAHRADHQRSLA